MCIRDRFTPKELIHTPKDEWVFDLGQEITGIFKLHVHEPKGKEIRIQTGEILQDGCFYNENLRTALSEYVYISDGEEKDIVPHFTFYGYRYVKISGVTNVSCEDFTGMALYSDYEGTGSIPVSYTHLYLKCRFNFDSGCGSRSGIFSRGGRRWWTV